VIVRIVGYDADDLVAFEAAAPADALPLALRLSGAPDLEHVAALAWPLSEADARAIVGTTPSGLTYALEGTGAA
jgi:hypothetical protein